MRFVLLNHVGGRDDVHLVSKLCQPSEIRRAYLHMYGCRAGGVVHSHHGCVFTEFIEHRADKLLAELHHTVS